MAEQEYVAANASAREQLRALIGRMSDADFARSVGGGWTAGTVLGHLAFWDRRVASIVARWQRDGIASPSPVDDDPINEALGPIWSAIPPREAARLALEAAEAADAALASLSDELAQAALAPDSPLNPQRAGHRHEHIAQIEAALRG